MQKEKVFLRFILPGILFSFIKKGLIFNRKTGQLLFSFLKSLAKGQFKRVVTHREYSAHLHINVEERFGRIGVGKRLMRVFFEYLKNNGISGVYLATFPEQAKGFFVDS